MRGSRRQVSLSIRRSARRGPYQTNEITQLNLLSPHIAKALRVAASLNQLNAQRQSLAKALEFSHNAILILDHKGHLFCMNRRAQQIVDNQDGFSLDAKGSPRATVPAQSDQLAQTIRVVIRDARHPTDGPVDVFPISRTSMRRPYQVLVAPLPKNQEGQDWRRGAIVIINDPDQELETPISALQKLYGLTITEARFLAVFVEEASLEGARERLALSKNTARTYMKRIFIKTDVATQSALMKLVLTGPVTSGLWHS